MISFRAIFTEQEKGKSKKILKGNCISIEHSVQNLG